MKIIFGCLAFLLAGCSMQQLGVRPNEPPMALLSSNPCGDYLHYASYVQELEDSYYARATGNRAGSYLGGAATAGSIAGSAGLAAGDSPSVSTLALMAIAQGFLGTLFNIFDNPQLAAIYTVAANGLASALDESFGTIAQVDDPHACVKAHVQLRHLVTKTRNNLELARTDIASAALQRALAQTKHYNEIASQFPTNANPPETTP